MISNQVYSAKELRESDEHLEDNFTLEEAMQAYREYRLRKPLHTIAQEIAEKIRTRKLAEVNRREKMLRLANRRGALFDRE